MKARVLTVDELKALPRLAIVFIEYFDGDEGEASEEILAGMKCYDGTIIDEDASIYDDFEQDVAWNADGYWRFWDTMPTEERRKEVPWK